MDTGKNDGKRENQEEIDLANDEEVKKLKTEFVGRPPKTLFDETRQHNQQVADSIKKALDKGIKSRWVTKREKEQLKLFRFIISEQEKIANVLLSHTEAFYDFKEMLFTSFLDIERTKGLTAMSIGSLKSRMDKILENPAVRQLEKVLDANLEAFRNKDKLRQEVLRDSVV